MVILSKGRKLDNSESHNSLKFSFANIERLFFEGCWIWIFHWIKLSWHSCSSERHLDDSIDSSNFSLRKWFCNFCLFSFNQFMWRKDFLLLHRTYLRKTLWILTYVFRCFYLIQCLTSFSSINHLLHLYAWFLMLFHLT